MKNFLPLFLRHAFVAALLLLLAPFFTSAKVVYVTPSGAGNHNGLSWANACTLGEAADDFLHTVGNGDNIATYNDEIWLAKGTHTDGTPGGNYGLSFVGPVYGGFAGTETSRDQRNPAVNISIIANVTGNKGRWNYASLIEIANTSGQGAPMDGITFQNDYLSLGNNGITLNNCILTNSTFYPGGNFIASNCNFIANGQLNFTFDLESTGNFTNCLFRDYKGTNFTGGYIIGQELNFYHCQFVNNSSDAGNGGAASTQNSAFYYCVFDSNSTAGSGGALNGDRELTVENCLFANNTADIAGALNLSDDCFSTVHNCTFANNSANAASNTLYGASPYYGYDFANNIFAGSSNLPLAAFTQGVNSTIYNLSQDGSIGFKADPCLNNNFTLTACSPAINAGLNSKVDSTETTDMAGNARIYKGVVDLGCYEFAGTRLANPAITINTVPSGQIEQATYLCRGNVVLLEYNGNNLGGTYSWYTNDSLLSVTNQPSLLLAPPSGLNHFTFMQNNGCNLYSDTAQLTIGPDLYTPTLKVALPNPNQPICPGVYVSATTNPGSGGDNCTTGDTYQYSLDGGVTHFSYNPGDAINTTTATGQIQISGTRAGCTCSASNVIATWNLALVTPSVTIAASSQLVLPEQGVQFNATPVNAGSTPSYQWQQNGINVGNNASYFFANPVHDGDIVTCLLSHATGTTCLTSTTANSNSITIHVLSDSLSISSAGSCVGSNISLYSTLNPEMLLWYGSGNTADTSFATWNQFATVAGNPADTAPVAVCTDFAGNLYVGYHTMVIKYAPGDNTGTVVAGSQPYQIRDLSALFVDGNGNIYVADNVSDAVFKWAPGAVFPTVAAYQLLAITNPRGLYVDELGYVYLVTQSNYGVEKWGPNGDNILNFVAGFNNIGPGNNQLQNPGGITVDAQGNMYIADAGNNRIQKWGPGATSGTTVAGGNGAGNAANQLNNPTSVSIDQFGNMYINDAGNFRIQLWKSGATSGNTIAGGNLQGNGLNQLQQPSNACIDINGNIYVADKGDGTSNYGRVLQFSPSVSDTLLAEQTGAYQAVIYPFLSGETGNTTLISSNVLFITPPQAQVAVTVSAFPGNQVCSNMGADFVASPFNGGNNPSFQWYLNGNPTGKNDANFFYGNTQVGDKISCVLTSDAACVFPSTANSNTVTLVPVAATVNISLQGGGNTVCAGNTAVFTATSPEQAGVFYQWKKNGINVGANTPVNTYTDGALNNNDVISCEVTYGFPCANPATAVSNSITVSLLSASIGSKSTPVCQYMPLFDTLSLAPAAINWYQNGTLVQSSQPQWASGITVAGLAGFNTPNEFLPAPNGIFVDNKGFIYASSGSDNNVEKWSSVDTGASIIYGSANQLYGPGSGAGQFANPQGIFIDANNNIYVADASNNRVQKWAPGDTAGTTVAGGNGQGSGASQLAFPTAVFVDAAGNVYVADQQNGRIQKWVPGATSGITVAGGNNQFDPQYPDNFLQTPVALFVDASGTLYIADQNRVIRWPQGAPSGKTVAGYFDQTGSGEDQLNQASGVWVDGAGNIYISDQGNARIQVWQPGATSGFTAAGFGGPGNGPNQLQYPQGLYVDGGGNIYVADRGNNRVQKFSPVLQSIPIPATYAGAYTVAATSFNGCTAVSPPVFVNQAVNPSVSVLASPSTNICAGTTVEFNTSIAGGGSTPQFQWFKNNQLQPASTPYYMDGSLNNNDVIYCVLISNDVCASPPAAVSNNVAMNVSPNPSISITANPGNTICSGTSVLFTATSTNGGASPVYQWQKNGLPVGASASTYVDNTLKNNDVITCAITSSSGCVTISNGITMLVTTTVTPTISITDNTNNTICLRNAPVTFTAAATGGGNNPLFTFSVNGNMVQNGASSTYISAALSRGDLVSCLLTGNAACTSTNTASSNSITMLKPASFTVSTSVEANDTLCAGQVLIVGTQPSGGIQPYTYQWYKKQKNQPFLPFSNFATLNYIPQDGDVVYCVISCTDGCGGQIKDTTSSTAISVISQPVITCPVGITLNTDESLCSSSATIGTATAISLCGNSFTLSSSPSAPYAKGITTVTWKAVDDITGGTATCAQLVTVNDSIAPNALGQNITVQLDVNHQASVSAAQIDNGSFDNCGNVTLSIISGQISYSCSDVGQTYPVTLQVQDAAGNTSTAVVNVTVAADNNPCCAAPAAICKSTTVFLDAQGNGSLTPGDIDGGSTAPCGLQSLTVSQSAFTCTDAGFKSLNLTLTDVNSVTSGCQALIFVADTISPTITCSPDISVTANAPACTRQLTITTPVTADNCGVASIVNNFNNTADASGTYAPGTTPVIWTVTDIHGSTATCSQVITIYNCLQISGTAINTLCSGTASGSIQASASGGSGAYTYNWNNGTSTGNISGLAAGVYTLTVSDTASGSATATFTVGTTIPSTRPQVPGAISGATAFCPGDTITYSIAAVPNTTSYSWTAPLNASILSGQGTTQVSVVFPIGFVSGLMHVKASNCKGVSAASHLTTGIYKLPARPAIINGIKAVCLGAIETYNIPAVLNATGYAWSVPANAVIQSGQNTTQISVLYQPGFTGGAVGVYASNCHGNGLTRNLITSLLAVPARPSSITGDSAICAGSSYTYEAASVNNAVSYNWTAPVNASIVSGQGNMLVTVAYANGFTSGSLSVYASDCAGNGRAISKLIKAGGCEAGKMDALDTSAASTLSPAGEFEAVIYPNPFSDQFHLKLQSSAREVFEIKVFNIAGQLLQVQTQDQSGDYIIIGDALASGMYFVEVKQAGKIKTLRIVKSE